MKLTPDIIETLVYHHILSENDDYRFDNDATKTYDFHVDWQCTVSIANWVAVHQLYGYDSPPLHSRGSWNYSPDSLSLEEYEDLPEELIEALLGLVDYPLIDDEVHSEVEWDIIETDVVECLDSFIYSDTVDEWLTENDQLEDDFRAWFEEHWSSYTCNPTECIELASFHIDFEEAFGKEELENIFQDFLAAFTIKGLAQQGLQQDNLPTQILGD